jgi:hypothetical protein
MDKQRAVAMFPGKRENLCCMFGGHLTIVPGGTFNIVKAKP